MNNTKNYLIALVIVAFFVGAGAGYMYGKNTGLASGIEQGRNEIFSEQERVADAQVKSIQEAINPFTEEETVVNPFEGGYVNPFEGGGVNPFSQ